MQFTFTFTNEEDAETILTWSYEAPYTTYTMEGKNAEERAAIRAEMLDLSNFYSLSIRGTSARYESMNELVFGVQVFSYRKIIVERANSWR